MKIEMLPTLQVLHDLYSQPEGIERFRAYLEKMIAPAEDGEPGVVLPITNVNPMGKEQCLSLVDKLIEMRAEDVLEAAIAEAAERLEGLDGMAKVCINPIDDVGGGWTDRYFLEAELRLGSRESQRANLTRRFVVVSCWTSEIYTPELIRRETLAAIFRLAWRDSYGVPESLGATLTAEGNALRFAGLTAEDESSILAPALAPDDLEYAADVINGRLNATDYPTLFTCWFGDEAAGRAGYRQLGLKPRAGFAVALARAMRSKVPPEQALALSRGPRS
jgi:hypothetical protein